MLIVTTAEIMLNKPYALIVLISFFTLTFPCSVLYSQSTISKLNSQWQAIEKDAIGTKPIIISYGAETNNTSNSELQNKMTIKGYKLFGEFKKVQIISEAGRHSYSSTYYFSNEKLVCIFKKEIEPDNFQNKWSETTLSEERIYVVNDKIIDAYFYSGSKPPATVSQFRKDTELLRSRNFDKELLIKEAYTLLRKIQAAY